MPPGTACASAGSPLGDPNGIVVNDPGNPLADAQGNVYAAQTNSRNVRKYSK